MTTDENVKWAGREKRSFKLISQVREEEDFLADFVGAAIICSCRYTYVKACV